MKFKIGEVKVMSKLKGNSRFFFPDLNFSSFFFVYLIAILF